MGTVLEVLNTSVFPLEAEHQDTLPWLQEVASMLSSLAALRGKLDLVLKNAV